MENGSESVEDLKQALAARADQLKAKAQEAQELQDKLLRLAAEFENFKKITQRDQQEFSRYANENLLRELLPILDNLERAIGCGKEGHKSDGLLQGVELTLKQFVEMLAKFGVRPVTSVGERFDPTRHQAVARVNTAEKPENTVVDEYQKGYQIHDRILRAAMVTVATASSETPEPSEASSQKPEGRPATGSQDTPGENPNP